MKSRAVLLLILGCAVPALAQRGGRGSPADVWKYLAEKYDADENGRITDAEYGRGADKFAAYDRDGDGVLTAADFAGGGRGRRRGAGNRRGAASNTTARDIAVVLAKNSDTDDDGEVTPLEWKKALDTLDQNQNRIADADEITGIMCAALGRKRLSERAVTRRSRHLDKNKDGKIQLSELGALFETLDADADDRLSKSELGSSRPPARRQPRVGEMAPDFSLPLVDDRKTEIELSSFRGRKPVALVFGSYT